MIISKNRGERMSLIIGNIIALIGSLLMVYAGVIKDKKGILLVQSFQIGLLATSNLVLNGISGFIINMVNFIRNIICYEEALFLKVKILLSIISIVLTIYFNNHGLIGYLPLISGLLYLWFMTVKDAIKFKILIIVSVLFWLIYDFTIQSYTACVFDLITIIVSFISVINLKKKD